MNKELSPRMLVTHTNPKNPAAEAFRVLRTNLFYTNLDNSLRKVMVTSAGTGEGKSTVLANLAIAVAQAGHKVLLIDADLRKPRQHRLFEMENREGLSTAIVEKGAIDRYVKKTMVENLWLITSGPIPPNPSEMLGSSAMAKLLEETTAYDFVLIDAPPAIAVTDAVVLSAKVDGVLLVLNSREVKTDMAKETVAMLKKANARILGAVLNNVEYKGDDYLYYYYYREEQS